MPTPDLNWVYDFHDLLNFLISYGVVVPLLIGVWRWSALSRPAQIITGYFAFWFAEAFVDQWSRRTLHTNMYLFHVTVLVETWLLGWAYYEALRAPAVRRLLLPFGLVFTLVALLDAFWISGLDHQNKVARTCQVVLMLMLAFAYFEQWLSDLRGRSPWHNFMFVVSVAQVIYYAGSVMGYLVKQSGNELIGRVTGLVIDSTYLVSVVLMTLALWRDGRPQRVPYAPGRGGELLN
ncbi:hypothetical protein GCM10027048_28500 [Hymenobacter coalescens]